MAKYKQYHRARLTITLSPNLYHAIQQMGKDRVGGVSGVIEDCLRDYLGFEEVSPEALSQIQFSRTHAKVQSNGKVEYLPADVVFQAIKDVIDEKHQELMRKSPRKKKGVFSDLLDKKE